VDNVIELRVLDVEWPPRESYDSCDARMSETTLEDATSYSSGRASDKDLHVARSIDQDAVVWVAEARLRFSDVLLSPCLNCCFRTSWSTSLPLVLL